jgi:7-cyano-7-deazaguanine synthase
MPTNVVLLSGGLDSSILAAQLSQTKGPASVHALSVHYGQRHSRELEAASEVAAYLEISHRVVDLQGLRSLLNSSQTSDDVPVPHGHYADPNMRLTVVPNRNMILLAIAAGYAISLTEREGIGPSTVYLANHAGDHAVYPDCRPEFTAAMNVALGLSHYTDSICQLDSPYKLKTKGEIIKAYGQNLSPLYAMTWSCYEGGRYHCGKCGTCVERKEAFLEAGVFDPTVYNL